MGDEFISIEPAPIRSTLINIRERKELRQLPIMEEIEMSFMKDIDEGNKPSLLGMAWFIITKSPKIVSLVYQFVRVLNMNEDKKTTFMATVKVACGIIALALSIFKIDFPAGIQETLVGISGSIYLVFSWLQGFWTGKKEEPAK